MEKSSRAEVLSLRPPKASNTFSACMFMALCARLGDESLKIRDFLLCYRSVVTREALTEKAVKQRHQTE